MSELGGEFVWQAWKFERSPRGFWQSLAAQFHANDPYAISTVTVFIEELAKKHDIRALSEWETLAVSDLNTTIRSQLKHLGSLHHVLKVIYPSHNWKIKKEDEMKGSNLEAPQFKERHMAELMMDLFKVSHLKVVISNKARKP